MAYCHPDESPCIPSDRHRHRSGGTRAADVVAGDRRRRASRSARQGLDQRFSWAPPAFRCWAWRGRRSPRSSQPPRTPGLRRSLHSVFGVALPEETVKILVIVAVSTRRRPFADPMDTVIYGAAAGLGFAAYENLRLSRAACRDVAFAGGAAQRPDGAVPRRARHHRRRLSCDRTVRHRTWRTPASPRLGAHLKPHSDPVCAAGAARRVLISLC